MSTHDDAPDSAAGSTDSPLGTTTGPVPAAPAEPAPRARLRVATVVWGLVITAIGIMVLATASGVSFDLGLVMIGLIGFAGIALLIGSIASGIRHRHP
ncbi:hypothetical protein GALL_306260 [mine drainage metagenome]|uniref:Uncharacterized protein n=1 Tax=mine drainage metagenome TaxID=410659 RepID=A0A1J5QW27_9ZZZZ